MLLLSLLFKTPLQITMISNNTGATTCIYIHLLSSSSRALQTQPFTDIFIVKLWSLITDIHSKRLPFLLANYKIHTLFTHIQHTPSLKIDPKHCCFSLICPFAWFCDPLGSVCQCCLWKPYPFPRCSICGWQLVLLECHPRNNTDQLECQMWVFWCSYIVDRLLV